MVQPKALDRCDVDAGDTRRGHRRAMLQRRVDATVARRVGSPTMVWLIVLLVIVALLVIALIALYNRFVRLPQPRRQRVGADRGAAQASVGPDPEPRRDREGLRGARARHVRGRHRGAGQRAARAGTGGDGGRRGHPRPGARPPVRGRRGVPGAPGRRELPAAPDRAGRRRRTGSPCRGRSTTTPSSRTTTRSRRSPGSSLAGPFGFAKREFFETDETQREAPHVDFSPGAGTAAPSVEPPPASVPPAAPAEPEASGSGAPGGTS